MPGNDSENELAALHGPHPVDLRLKAIADVAVDLASHRSPVELRASSAHARVRRLAFGYAIGLIAAIVLLVASFGTLDLFHESHNDRANHGGPTLYSRCNDKPRSEAFLAITDDGTVVAVDPQSFVTTPIAKDVLANGNIAVRPELDIAYVTSRSPNGLPAVWSVPLHGCDSEPELIEGNAELPAVSPDGGYLGFVTLNGRGEQTGVAIVGVGADGKPIGGERLYSATSVPPKLPITSIAVGRDGAALAVTGGFVDPYLRRSRSTTGTLNPSKSRSLRSLVPIFDGDGILPPGGRPAQIWQSASVYMPNGELLVGSSDTFISMPYSSSPPGSGGGFRDIAEQTGPVQSIAVGPGGDLAWITSGGVISVEKGAANLPYGPGADLPQTQNHPFRSPRGGFMSLAWTEGPQAENAPLPRVFRPIEHLPNVVGTSEAAAEHLFASLYMPVSVKSVASSRPAGTVLAQDPPAGDGEYCQCGATLTVSRK